MRSGYADAPVVAARITAGPTAVSWSAFWIARRWHDADSVSTAFRCPCINYAARMTSPSTAIAAAPRHLVPRSGKTHTRNPGRFRIGWYLGAGTPLTVVHLAVAYTSAQRLRSPLVDLGWPMFQLNSIHAGYAVLRT